MVAFGRIQVKLIISVVNNSNAIFIGMEVTTRSSCLCFQWIGDELGGDGGEELSASLRELSELVSRRRLLRHPLLGAALRLRVPAEPTPSAAPAAGSGAPSALLAGGAMLALAAVVAAGSLLLVRRRRVARALERSRRCDEEKSNNLQNEENLRRYANPLREEGGGGSAGGASAGGGELPRAHTLYKAQNADARNDTPPRDKELTKRALPPPEPPRARLHPPERLTVLV